MLKPDNDVHDRSLTLCRNAGFTPNVSLYLSQMMTAYYLVCEGKGITFLRTTIPEFVTPTSGVVFYLLDDPQAFRNIYLSYSRSKTSPIHGSSSNLCAAKAREELVPPVSAAGLVITTFSHNYPWKALF